MPEYVVVGPIMPGQVKAALAGHKLVAMTGVGGVNKEVLLVLEPASGGGKSKGTRRRRRA